MGYKVKLTSPAEEDAYATFDRIREDAPAYAERWLHGLFQAVFSLREMPGRCPIIPEVEEVADSGVEIRQLLYGKGRGAYRIIFDIEEESDEGPLVRVLRIWHGSRDRLSAEDLIPEEEQHS